MHLTLTYLLIIASFSIAFINPAGSSLNSNTVESLESIIQWDEADPLSWYDFKGNAKNWTGISALTASAIEYSYDCYNDQLDVGVKAIFIPNESWVRKEAKTDYILAHEQLHFDITEIYARKLRQAISLEVKSCRDIWKIEQIAKKIIKEWKDVQHKYDKDTHHSINRELQVLWKEKVEYDLVAHIDYALENWVLSGF